jgi:hypothetical protein
LEQELLAFRKERDELGNEPFDRLIRLEKATKARILVQETNLKRRIEEQKRWIEFEKEKRRHRVQNLREKRRWNQDHWLLDQVQAIEAEAQGKIDRMEKEIRFWTVEVEFELKEIREDLSHAQRSKKWQLQAREKFMSIRTLAKRSLLNIVRQQRREYQKLFPPTCKKADTDSPVRQNQCNGVQVKSQEGDRERLPIQGEVVQGTRTSQTECAALQDGSKVDPTQLSARRGPPTDRPPDKPPPCKGALRGSLQERAGTRHVSQLASFTRGYYSLSGNDTPLQKMHLKVFSPSNYSASHAAGSSQMICEQSWRLVRCDRFRANGYVCCTRQPFQNLSRNLFPPRRFSLPGDSAAFNGTARQPSPVLGTRLYHPYSGPPGRCPVQPGTPLGPDQVNVLLLLDSGTFFLTCYMRYGHKKHFSCSKS